MIIPEQLAIHAPDESLLKIINNKKFDDKILYECQSSFHNIKVIENEIGRFLHYNDTYQAGFINTPYYKGNLTYINYFLLPYFYKKDVKDVLLIGLGTGKIVSDLFKVFQNITRFDIVDIEENILNIAREFFDYKDNINCNFYLQDAIAYLKMIKKKYDLIIVDVAGNEGIDERFVGFEYLCEINKHLKKEGIFVSNLCSSADLENRKNRFFKKIKSVYAKSFPYFDIYKGNYSDKIYYNCFFGINERVIDITNIIIISSKSMLKRNDNSVNSFKKLFKNIDIELILNDIVK